MSHKLPVLMLTATLACISSPVLADLALAKSNNCMTCHAIDKKIVGPSYKDVASKYKGDASATSKLTSKVIEGGGGVWGAVPMPANSQVNEADAKKLVAWILATK